MVYAFQSRYLHRIRARLSLGAVSRQDAPFGGLHVGIGNVSVAHISHHTSDTQETPLEASSRDTINDLSNAEGTMLNCFEECPLLRSSRESSVPEETASAVEQSGSRNSLSGTESHSGAGVVQPESQSMGSRSGRGGTVAGVVQPE